MTAYIPHDQVAEETRAQSWDSLEHRALEIPEAKNIIIVGDFNSALHTRKQGEENVLGPNIYGIFRTTLVTSIHRWSISVSQRNTLCIMQMKTCKCLTIAENH